MSSMRCLVGIQVLDRDRNPIQDAKLRVDYCGRSEELSSGKNGRLPDIFTHKPDDRVDIFIARPDGSWKKITEVISEPGNKLVTLVSPKIKITAETKEHPKDSAGRPVADKPDPDKKSITPPENPKSSTAEGKSQSDFGDGKGIKTQSGTAPNGAPIEKVTNDQAELDFLNKGYYSGEKITEDDYKDAAKELGNCEVEVIKAIGYKESAILRLLGLGSFDKQNRPTILYERHIFSAKSNKKYDKTNPDISNAKAYTKGTARKNKKAYDDGMHYGLFSWQYPRFAKAYALNKDAAICACSWGKFQVMGANFASCGFSSPVEFARAMCKSELEHLKAMTAFCKANNLQPALKAKNWAQIAKTYNGTNYKNNQYDTDLESIYNEFKSGKI